MLEVCGDELSLSFMLHAGCTQFFFSYTHTHTQVVSMALCYYIVHYLHCVSVSLVFHSGGSEWVLYGLINIVCVVSVGLNILNSHHQCYIQHPCDMIWFRIPYFRELFDIALAVQASPIMQCAHSFFTSLKNACWLWAAFRRQPSGGVWFTAYRLLGSLSLKTKRIPYASITI